MVVVILVIHLYIHYNYTNNNFCFPILQLSSQKVYAGAPEQAQQLNVRTELAKKFSKFQLPVLALVSLASDKPATCLRIDS